MKKLLNTVCNKFILAFLFAVISVSAFSETFQLGDLAPRGAPDGQLNAADALILQQIILGNIVPSNEEALIGDVAPLNNTDGELNAGDLAVQQRAILGLISLGNVSTGPDAPQLTDVSGTGNNNPLLIAGTATPSLTVDIYVNDVLQGSTIADITTGNFSYPAILQEGNNTIHAVAFDGVDESSNSNIVTYNFQYADGGTLSGNQGGVTLVANTRYLVTADITVTNGQTLTIEAGAKIEFDAGAKLLVQGISTQTVHLAHIVVTGSSSIPVIFTSSSQTPAVGDWQGIEIGTYATVMLDRVIIEYANIGISISSLPDGGIVTNSVIRNNNTGIKVTNSLPVITNNEIYSNINWNYYADNFSYQDSLYVTLDAKNNWWGSNDPIIIADAIYDYTDTVGLESTPAPTVSSPVPIIDVTGYLAESGGVPQLVSFMPPVILISSPRSTFANETIYQFSDVWVAANATLTLNEGANVRLTGDYRILVTGVNNQDAAIVVNGTALNPVVFTSNSPNPAASDWQGIDIGLNAVAQFDYAIIEYADTAVAFDLYKWGAPQGIAYANINNSIIRHNVTGVRVTKRSRLTLTNSELYDNLDWNYYADDIVGLNQVYITLDATNNWWGTSDIASIETSIYDYRDLEGVVPSYSTPVPVVNFSGALDAQNGSPLPVYVNDSIATNITFDSDVYINGTVTILPGVTVTISPNTIIHVAANSQLVVEGTLLAVGDANNTIRFLPTEPTSDRSYWAGLKVAATGQLTLDYCHIANADKGIWFEGEGGASANESSFGTVSHCVITQNNYGVYISGNTGPTFTANSIVDNNVGIYLDGTGLAAGVDPHPTFVQNDIYGNTLYNVQFSSVTVDASGVTFTDNWWGTSDLLAIQSTFSGINSVNFAPLLVNRSQNSNQTPVLQGITAQPLYISPQASPAIQDVYSIAGNFSSTVTWELNIYDSSRNLMYATNGTGAVINEQWNGVNQSALPLPDGVYAVNITSNNVLAYSNNIVIDNTAPQVSITSPVVGYIANDNLTIDISSRVFDLNPAVVTVEKANGVNPTENDYIELFSLNTEKITNEYSWPAINPTTGEHEVLGNKTIRVSETDKAGNTGSMTATIVLDYISITNVINSSNKMDPRNGESIDITFSLGKPATVLLNIYPELEINSPPVQGFAQGYGLGVGATLIKQYPVTYSTAGTYTINWDGKNEAGEYVSQDAYRYEIVADDGVQTSTYMIPITALSAYTPAPAFASYSNVAFSQNKYVKIYSSIPQGEILRHAMNIGYPIGNSYEVLEAGDYLFLADGRTGDGRYISGSMTVTSNRASTYFELSPGSLFVKNKKPKLLGTESYPNIEIKSNPYLVKHSYDQISRVEFIVDEDAYVTVQLLEVCDLGNTTCSTDPAIATVKTLMNNQLLIGDDGIGDAEINEFEWRGYDFEQAGADTNNMLVGEEGVYTYLITATSVATGNVTTYRGSLQLYQ